MSGIAKPAKWGAVAAGHQATAEAAAEILEDGGNAFDAALGGMLAACVCEMVLASICGGGFLMALPAGRSQPVLYDFFTATPSHQADASKIDFRAILADFGPATQEFHIGAGSTAVPGVPAGIQTVHRELGSLSMARIAEPAIRLARHGVTTTPFQAYLFGVIAPILTASPQAAAIFAPSGEMLAAGDLFRNPEFADALDLMVADVAGFASDSPFVTALVAQSLQQGGQLQAGDLKGYQVERRSPLEISVHGSRVALNPAPSAGGPLVGFGLALDARMPGDGLRTDALPKADASMRNLMLQQATNRARADAGWSKSPIEKMIARELDALSGLRPAYRGTTHISVIDSAGNAAALTISNGEGNGLMLPGLGVMPNNMLGEEDLNPGGFQRWTPGARLSSMMAPTIALASDGSITALGSGGSNRIRSAILSVLLNLIDQRMPLDDAVTAPRLHLEKCGTLSFEDQLPTQAKSRLLEYFPEARAWPEPNMFFGGVHAVRRLADGRFEAVGDQRRDGAAILV